MGATYGNGTLYALRPQRAGQCLAVDDYRMRTRGLPDRLYQFVRLVNRYVAVILNANFTDSTHRQSLRGANAFGDLRLMLSKEVVVDHFAVRVRECANVHSIVA